jgi:gamma-glutamyltranspeptidase/glutathione hydrolase
MFHTSHFPESFAPHAARPGSLYIEPRVEAAVLGELRARGHDVIEANPWSLGRLCVVARDGETGLLSAAANARGGQGYAAGR